MKNSCHGAGPMPGKPADSDTRAHSQGGALNYTARGNASQHIALVLEDAVRLGAMADPIGAVALFQRLPLPGHPMGRHSTGASWSSHWRRAVISKLRWDCLKISTSRPAGHKP